jgi:hypothetical protein
MRDWITCQNPTSLRSPSDRSTLRPTITSGFTIFSWSGGARPRAGDLYSGFGVVAGVLLALTLRSILSRSEWERREQIS